MPPRITRYQLETMARAQFVQRITEMLIETESVDPNVEVKALATIVAEVLDEAEAHGIASERLLGMYALLRIADDVEPFTIPEYASVLRDPGMAEPDKARALHEIRLTMISDEAPPDAAGSD